MVKVPDQKFVERGNHLNKNRSAREPFEDLWTFACIASQEGSGIFMARVERYRHYAVECLRLARESESIAEKNVLLQMAEHWKRLAECAEKDEKRRRCSIAP
jgi:hypothetical protein